MLPLTRLEYALVAPPASPSPNWVAFFCRQPDCVRSCFGCWRWVVCCRAARKMPSVTRCATDLDIHACRWPWSQGESGHQLVQMLKKDAIFWKVLFGERIDICTFWATIINICHIYSWFSLLLLISMLWHRQAIFELKGYKLSSSAECRIRTQGFRHQIASRLIVRWQTHWSIEDQDKNLNSTTRPYDKRAFSPLDPTAGE